VTLVSVCIPAHNHADFLAEAIESALGQPVPGLEVIVCDDASTDGTAAVLGAIGDARVLTVRHDRAVGVAAARNSCLARASGRYIAWLDADDAYLPDSLAPRLAVLERCPQVGLVHAAFHVTDAAGRRLRDWPPCAAADVTYPVAEAFRRLITSNMMATSTVVVRRELVDRVGGFSAGAGRCGSDWHMWLRLSAVADIGYLATPAAGYRQHPSTITRGSGARLRLACDRRVVADVLRRERRRLATPDTVAAAHAALAAKALLSAGDAATAGRRGEAIRQTLSAARLSPRAARPAVRRAAGALARGDEYGCYRQTRLALASLAAVVGETPFGERLRRAAAWNEDYEATLARAARRIREVTRPDARIATVTKWDPTLLRLAHRRGAQFPDRRRFPDGYPTDDRAAVAQLELARETGLTHLVFIRTTAWWLDHYAGFREHLSASARLVHDDSDCRIYDLCR